MSNVESINKHDIYRIHVSMHRPILQGENGPNPNQKAGNSLSNWNPMVKVIKVENYRNNRFKEVNNFYLEMSNEEQTFPKEANIC